MSRKTAREVAMKLAYASTFGCDDTYASVLDKSGIDVIPDEVDIKYAHSVMEGIADNLEELDKLIASASLARSIERIPRVDLSILRVAVYELCFMKSLSHRIIIDEAVRISKKYGGENSPRFVNGVLAAIIKQTES